MITLKLRSKISAPKLLVIEDEVQLAEVCRTILSNAGAKTRVIYDGADALGEIDAFKPDVILSDIKMPETRGDELLVSLHADYPKIPLILMTGLPRNRVSIPQNTPNLFALLYKPLEYDQLIRTVQNALNLVEAQHCKDLLLQELHAKSASHEDYFQWQDRALGALMTEWNKRRAS